MLFMDWLLEEGQALILENGLTPAIMPDGSDPLEGVELVPVDVDQLLEEGDEWSDRYDELLPTARSSRRRSPDPSSAPRSRPCAPGRGGRHHPPAAEHRTNGTRGANDDADHRR